MPAKDPKVRRDIKTRYKLKHREKVLQKSREYWARPEVRARSAEQNRLRREDPGVKKKHAQLEALRRQLTPREREIRSASNKERRLAATKARTRETVDGRWGPNPLGPHLSPREYSIRQNLWLRRYRARSPQYAIACNLRARLGYAMKLMRAKKEERMLELLGCSLAQLIRHLEKQFCPGMHWGNRGKGRGKWNVDHIIPLAAFDLRDAAQRAKASHYSNLQPLWSEENRAKWDKLPNGALARRRA